MTSITQQPHSYWDEIEQSAEPCTTSNLVIAEALTRLGLHHGNELAHADIAFHFAALLRGDGAGVVRLLELRNTLQITLWKFVLWTILGVIAGGVAWKALSLPKNHQ